MLRRLRKYQLKQRIFNVNTNHTTWFVLIMLFFITSCGQKFYRKNDYSFYEENFVLDYSSYLRIDGFYILEGEWNKRNDSLGSPEKHEAYKFYKTGQVNIALMDSLKDPQRDFYLIQKQFDENYKQQKGSTLFQGYYRMKGTKIIIQQVNVPLRQFYYLYGYLEKNKLIFVKKSIDGGGEFKEDYFAGIYKEIYKFVPFNKSDNVTPNW